MCVCPYPLISVTCLRTADTNVCVPVPIDYAILDNVKNNVTVMHTARRLSSRPQIQVGASPEDHHIAFREHGLEKEEQV